ncbi:porin [Azonexus sp.]|uniref:porin n=1 Tax=Azonexus sp. TaxID=1872668 RepID=UPI0027BA9558|nr:porin [Azonexus sp.]
MQKKIIALAIAGLASTAAFAQSNVTVYGIADVGYAYSFGGGQGSQHNVTSGGLSGSRIGFKGVEDLGNGLKALFTLEYSVDVDSNVGIGTGASAGARQQFVGLTGGFGTVVAGRLQTAGYDFACATSPIAGSALDAHNKVGVAALLSCGGNGRANNAFAYISPSFSGLTLAYNHARVTEAAASSNTDDVYANLLSAQYANGGLKLNLTYARADDNDQVALGGDKRTEYGVTGSYNFGVATVFGAYQTNKTDGFSRNDKASLAVAVPVGAKGTVVGQYARNSIDTANNADSSAYTVAYTHALSKRTTAYAGYTHVVNDGGVNLAAGFQTVGAGKDPSIVALGVRHAF